MSKFITLTKLQNREPTLLQTVIDNTCGKLNIALKSFHYEVGYRNLDPSTTFGHTGAFILYGGMYTFEQISRFLMEEVPGITLRLNMFNQTELNIPDSVVGLSIGGTLLHFLGLELYKKVAYTRFFSGQICGKPSGKNNCTQVALHLSRPTLNNL